MKIKATTAGAAFIVVMLTVLFIAVGPFITIAALNGLGCHIPYTFITWLCAFWFHILFAAKSSS